jgi:2'-5' RNA ligase
MRLFVACELDEAIRDRLAAVAEKAEERIDGVKWVAHGNIHITLKFLGEVEDAAVDEIAAAIGAAVSETKAFTLSVRGLGAFPPKGSPQVLWAGVSEGADGLVSLNDAVERALEPIGFEREKRSFSPHATLGRVRKKARPKGLRELVEAGRTADFGSQEVTEITLMRSVLKPTGPIYTPVHTWTLEKRS